MFAEIKINSGSTEKVLLFDLTLEWQYENFKKLKEELEDVFNNDEQKGFITVDLGFPNEENTHKWRVRKNSIDNFIVYIND